MEQLRVENQEFEGPSNAYLFEAEPTTLIDTGIATETGRRQLTEALSAHGYGFSDIEQIFLTHFHYDHAGLAGDIQAASGATVYAHELECQVLPGVGSTSLLEFDGDRVDAWGIPDEQRERLEAYLAGVATLAGEPVEVTPVKTGSRLEVPGDTVTVHHAPGHTAGHVVFSRVQTSDVFGGDVILPTYTPNIGGADIRLDDPLGTYLETLEWFDATQSGPVWPGHGDRIDDVSGRIRSIRAHHRRRLDRVADVLDRDRPSTPWEVALAVFGSLAGIHVLNGTGEAAAHLTHLERHGVVARRHKGYVRVDEHEVNPGDLVRDPPSHRKGG